MTDSASTEHTPPTAELVASAVVGHHNIWGDEQWSIACDVVAALRAAGLLPESPSAAMDKRDELVRWLKARFHGGESIYEPAYDDADAILQLLDGRAPSAAPTTDTTITKLIEQLGDRFVLLHSRDPEWGVRFRMFDVDDYVVGASPVEALENALRAVAAVAPKGAHQ